MKDSISTEGRIFASKLAREVKRLERTSAPVLFKGLRPKAVERVPGNIDKYAEWGHCLSIFMSDFQKERSPNKRLDLMRKAVRKLDAIPDEDRGFIIHSRPSESKRVGSFTLTTFHEDDHPMEVMTGYEHGVLTYWHGFEVTRAVKGTGLIAQLQAYVSDHALGRLWERWTGPKAPTMVDGLLFIMFCRAVAGIAWQREELSQSGITFPFYPSHDSEPLYAEGRMWRTNNDKAKQFCNWFDCRTVLPREALTKEQLVQAERFDAYFLDAPNVEIPATVPHDNFVSQTLAASQQRH